MSVCFLTQHKRHSAKNSETTINEPPAERDASDMPCNKGKGNDAATGDETEGDDPFIRDGINVRPYECNGDG